MDPIEVRVVKGEEKPDGICIFFLKNPHFSFGTMVTTNPTKIGTKWKLLWTKTY